MPLADILPDAAVLGFGAKIVAPFSFLSAAVSESIELSDDCSGVSSNGGDCANVLVRTVFDTNK